MTNKQAPVALRLAEELEHDPGINRPSVVAELRRLHAENTALQQGYDAARLEIDSLQARVQELGAMLRENRSKRIVELEAQLEAIGAGGVEPLRRRECLHQISEPAPVLGEPTWTVFNSGAEVAEVESLAEAMEYLTPERLSRQWCAVCVVNQSNMPKDSAPAAPAAQGDAEDAARYRCIRRGQHWSVIDSIGNELRAEALDAAIDAALKKGEHHD